MHGVGLAWSDQGSGFVFTRQAGCWQARILLTDYARKCFRGHTEDSVLPVEGESGQYQPHGLFAGDRGWIQ
jgi:hypothetical protein